jgi:hypothetical protein
MLHVLPVLVDFLHPLPILLHLFTEGGHFLCVHVVFVPKELLELLQGNVALPILIYEADHLDCAVHLLPVALFLEETVQCFGGDVIAVFRDASESVG